MIRHKASHKAGVFQREREQAIPETFLFKIELADVQIPFKGILRKNNRHLRRIVEGELTDDSIIVDQPRRDRCGHHQAKGDAGNEPVFQFPLIGKKCKDENKRQNDERLRSQQQQQPKRAARDDRRFYVAAFKPADDDEHHERDSHRGGEIGDEHFRASSARVGGDPQRGEFAEDGEKGNRHTGGAGVEFCAEKIQRNGKQREDQRLRGDDFDIVLSEQKMERGEERHIQGTRRDVAEIVRADEQGLREVVVKSCVGIWEGSCVWRRDGSVETVF